MAIRNKQPARGGFAAAVALITIAAAPVLAAPERSICEEAAEPTLDVATTEFSRTAATETDESIELLGPNFEFASRDLAVAEEDEPEQAERGAVDDTDSASSDSATPAEAGPLVFKRQMYRRDI